MPASIPPFQRLLSGYVLDERAGCWIWQGQTDANGYGQIKAFGKIVSAHRLSYELHKGPIADGMHILHSCDVKRCVNPDHLRAGTHAENMAEAASRNRMRRGEDHPMFGRRNPRPDQSNPVLVLGQEYESQKAAERALGLGSGTVRYWLKNHPHKAQKIEKGSAHVVGE